MFPSPSTSSAATDPGSVPTDIVELVLNVPSLLFFKMEMVPLALLTDTISAYPSLFTSTAIDVNGLFPRFVEDVCSKIPVLESVFAVNVQL